MAASPTAPSHRDGSPDLPARVVLRPQGSPFPFGFSGLAIASLLVTGLDWGWIPVLQGKQVGWLLLVTAVPLQAIAATFSFPARDGAAAASMGVLSATWASIGLTHLLTPPGSASNALATVLLMSAGLLVTSAMSQGTGKLLTALVVALAATRFACSGLYQFTGSGGWQDTSGAVGIVVAAVALYAVWALQLEDAQDRTVLPTLRHGRGKQALSASGREQLQGVDHEPGVRAEL